MSSFTKTPRRRLTVTYYVDPHSLRTVSISIHRANILIFCLAGATVWTMVSGVFLGIRFFADSSDKPLLAQAAQTSGLKEELVQEDLAAAPAEEVVPAASELTESLVAPVSLSAAEVILKDPLVADAPSAPLPIEQLLTPDDQSQMIPSAAAFGPPASLAKQAAAPLGQRLAVKEAAFAYKPDEGLLNLDFKVQNLGIPEAKGKIWGVATFTTKSGKRLEIASADGVSFRAKSVTKKALQFPLPESEPGYIAEVSIHVTEETANDELVSTYQLDESGQTVQ